MSAMSHNVNLPMYAVRPPENQALEAAVRELLLVTLRAVSGYVRENEAEFVERVRVASALTREEAAKAVADLKAKGMAVNEVSPQEVGRMREKLTRVNASIAANVGMELWTETQNELAKLRGGK